MDLLLSSRKLKSKPGKDLHIVTGASNPSLFWLLEINTSLSSLAVLQIIFSTPPATQEFVHVP